MTFAYVDTPSAMYGTAYGAMLTTKLLMFAAVLLCGFMNFRVVERLRRNPATPVLRLRRFAEAEVGIGLTLFFVGASIASVPPAIDLPFDRLQVSEIVDRLALSCCRRFARTAHPIGRDLSRVIDRVVAPSDFPDAVSLLIQGCTDGVDRRCRNAVKAGTFYE